MPRRKCFDVLPPELVNEVDAALIRGDSPRALAKQLRAGGHHASHATLYARRAFLAAQRQRLIEAGLIAGIQGEPWEIAYLAAIGKNLCARYPQLDPRRSNARPAPTDPQPDHPAGA